MSPEQFIRKICHDVRAPVRALHDIPKWLEADLEAEFGALPPAIKELLEMQKTQSERLDIIITGLSDLAKLKRSEAHPVTCVADITPDAGWPENLRCVFEVDYVPLERDHACLAVWHLVENAFKHAAQAPASVDLKISRSTDGVEIAVSDTGPGIAPEFFETVYEPLTTLRSRDECEGSGMGLAIVSQIAALYGGSRRITANTSGVGLTSRLVVPTV